MARQYKELYGMMWPLVTSPLEIEFQMIRKGGTIKRKEDGVVVGNGLFWHWKRAQELIWPEKKWHKWNLLQSECYTKYRTVVVIGPASSGKTNTSATDALLDYYLYPSCTSIIICSTTRERLEDRIWGELKKYHRQAQDRYPWLPGHLIEGRLRLVTDHRSMAEEGRDFRSGIIGVSCKRGQDYIGIGEFCFPSGTLVDTASGSIPIENIKIGDVVTSALGPNRVIDTHSRISPTLVRVKFSDGRSVDCTPDHPFLTSSGWINALDLLPEHYVFSPYETMRSMSEINKSKRPDSFLLSAMPRAFSDKNLSKLQKVVSSKRLQELILREILHDGSSNERPGNGSTDFKEQGFGGCWEKHQCCDLVESKRKKKASRFDEGQSGKVSIVYSSQKLDKETAMWPISLWGFWRKRSATYASRTSDAGYFSRSQSMLCENENPAQGKRGVASCNSRFGVGEVEVGGLHRRNMSRKTQVKRQGLSSEFKACGAWVESVEVLKRSGDDRYDESQGGYRVYNIAVGGHPSYSVNGLVVHNCGIKNKRVRLIGDEISFLPKAFVDAISNLDKNEDFKAVGLGNPKDTLDALGVLAEPSSELGGWDSGIDQTPETKTWPIRRPDGICVQLVGSDSPNLDGKLGIPLITQEQIDRDVAFYGKDSMQFTMMNQGMMPRGQSSHRVLTRNMCIKFGAMDEPIWRDTRIKKIAWLDAGYGGDRCTFGEIQFGQLASAIETPVATIPLANDTVIRTEHKPLLHLVDSMVVPVSAAKGANLPEDQIVEFVVAELARRGIPMEDFFYEPGMRTKLTVAFARITGKTGNPIDCMGKATERQVAQGIDVLCCDYYSKFVTELWYSVRLAVEAGQVRGMTEEIINEFSSREWYKVAGNKIELEPKDKMKAKFGRSPDLADGFAIGVEGCRQRGFVIVKIGAEVMRKNEQRDRWKGEALEKARKSWTSGDLNYAA